MVAKKKARSGRANAIGISIASGGIGKNELSAKETQPRIQAAWGLPAASMHQSYRRRSMSGAYGLSSKRCLLSVTLRCEPTGPARSGRPDDRLREPRRIAAQGDRNGSAPLACAAAFQHDDFAARKIFRQLFRDLLGNAKKPLAPVHFLPNV